MGYPEEGIQWEECQDLEKKKACRQLSEDEEPGEETGKEQRDSERTGQRSASKGRRDLQRGNDQQFSLG